MVSLRRPCPTVPDAQRRATCPRAGERAEDSAHLLQGAEVPQPPDLQGHPVQGWEGLARGAGCANAVLSLRSGCAAEGGTRRAPGRGFLHALPPPRPLLPHTPTPVNARCAGKRRYDNKQAGFGGQTKPAFHKKGRPPPPSPGQTSAAPRVPSAHCPGRRRAQPHLPCCCQAKTTKKITLRLTCTACKTVRLKPIKRSKHFEICDKKPKGKSLY